MQVASSGSDATAKERPASGRGGLREALAVSADVTIVVAAIAAGLPERWHTTLVGFVFLAATWALVWRHDDARVRRAGLALGGLVIPGKLEAASLARQAAVACAWAFGTMAVIAVPFFFAWRAWWLGRMPALHFSLAVQTGDAVNEILGQLFVIALPEEAFYRGYLQTRLDDVWRPRWRVLGASLGPGWLLTAVIFAVGHVATVHAPARLAVFFPALLFGWMRAKTGGIGASMTFHMLCNVYSQALGRGYGLY
jgi:membrane protease YdiL (CAAX protease family)